MKRSDIEVLNDDELAILARAYFDVLQTGSCIPSMKSERKAALRSLYQLFASVPEHVTQKYLNFSQQYRTTIYYPVVFKQIGSIMYYCNGCIRDSNRYVSIYGDPWEPKNPSAIKRYNNAFQDCELQYNKTLVGDDVEERMKAERDANRKQFLRFFKKYKSLLMKYQYYRYTHKKFVIPQRFLIHGRKFYEIMEPLKDMVLVIEKYGSLNNGASEDENMSQEDTFLLDRFHTISDSLYDFVHRIFEQIADFYVYNSNIELRFLSFIDEESIAVSDKHSQLTMRPAVQYPHEVPNYFLYDFKDIDFSHDDELERYLNIYRECRKNATSLCRALILYHMLSYASNETIPYFRDFCQTMGFIPPDTNEKEEEKEGSKNEQ